MLKRGFFVVLAVFLVLAGCSSAGKGSSGAQESENKPPALSTEPVTIRATNDGGTVINDSFVQLIQEQVHKKYPNITFEYFLPPQGENVEKMVARGDVPDIIFTFSGRLQPYKAFDLIFDMTPLIKQNNIDLNRFAPDQLELVQRASNPGELNAVPVFKKFYALYYNKDLFDKFGAPYPKDGMLMDEVLELTRRVSRVENGVQYRGLDPGSVVVWLAQPLNLFPVSADNKATINTEPWKKMFEYAKRIYDIPGNEFSNTSGKNQFIKDQRLAMLLHQNLVEELDAAAAQGLNWDMAQYPSFPEAPGIYPAASAEVMMITKGSKHKEHAMQVINAVISDEVQTIKTRQGLVTALKNPDIQKVFGADLKNSAGKNLQSAFKGKSVGDAPNSPFRQQAEGIVRDKFRNYISGQADVNTILRQAEEEINKLIAESQAK
jgi:multiple sugar transport system substrate-binding protein